MLSPTVGRHAQRLETQGITPRFGATVLAVLLLLYRTWQLTQSYFWLDDFVYLHRADTTSLGAAELLHSYGGHLMPGTFLAAEAVSAAPSHRWLLAGGMILALSAAAAYLAVRVVLELFGDRWGALIPLVALLFSPLWATPSLWWAAALQSLPLQISLLGSILAAQRYLQERQRSQVAIMAGWLAFGLFFWEKAVVVPPTALLILALVEAGRRGAGIFESARSVSRRLWAPIALCGAMVLGYLVFYAVSVDFSSQIRSSDSAFSAKVAALRYASITFLTGMVGGPWRATEGLDTQTPFPSNGAFFVAAQIVAVALVLAFLIGRRRRWLQAVLVAGLVVFADVASVAITRVGFWGPQIASDPRYFTEAVVTACLALGACLLTGSARHWSPVLAPVASRRILALGLVLLAFVNSALVTQQALTDVAHRRPGRAWVQEAEAGLAKAGKATVYDGPVPEEILGSFLFDDARASRVLSNPAYHITWNRSTTDLRIFDGQGSLRPADITEYESDAGKGPDKDCGWGVRVGQPRQISFEPTTLGDRPVVIGYFTDRPAEVTVEAGGKTQDFALPEGLHRIWLFGPKEVAGVRLDMFQGGTVCVTDVRVGKIWPKQ